MIDLYDKLNERIYENCKMYYNKYSKIDKMTDEQSGIMGGLYQSLNIVANEYLINNKNDNPKYRELLNNIEKLLKIA
ncbi:Uncharacterised protein [Streptococcus anginosus]|uniref:Uncharacterized protein n=3 Tax=Streptococcus anginosus TaxID=1328 RepID=A0AAP6BQ80_STRAP|nr:MULTISPECIES: hypothetical protein [Streptococcus]ALL03430.1 hypothetical protein SanJ4211_1343c [Streptococcus anginosus]EFW08061.1 hypothetical protein HMPREF9459_00095 [Streptococcus anginosus 1_2_62CV]MCW1035690.1 hypothetical protein [Streptococcus anginosus]MCW1066454.1 hypothetical protein [Streptococcus anginosus]MDU6599794.1 hypothetical protein [Streptococcus anginosus]